MAWLKLAPRVRTQDVLNLAGQDLLDAPGVDRALQLAGRVPTLSGWRRQLELVMLGLGAALIVAGIVCVVAFNWQAMGRWGRFGLAQALVLLVVGAAWWRGFDTLLGKTLLTVAIALIGPMLALFGQTYQTGADTFELFKGWALLAIPWVLASRFAPAWLLWVALIEIAVLFYMFAFDLWWVLFFGVMPPWLVACVFNAFVLVTWELASTRYEWLRGRLAPRLIATILLGVLTALTCATIFGVKEEQFALGALFWLLALGVGYWAYRVQGIELGMLSLGWLSVTIVLMAGLARILMLTHLELSGLLFGTLLLIGASALGRKWLRSLMVEADERAAAQAGSK